MLLSTDRVLTVFHITFFDNKYDNLAVLCSSRKYSYPPHGRLTEFPMGWGISKAQFFKGKYGTKMEFQRGWGV